MIEATIDRAEIIRNLKPCLTHAKSLSSQSSSYVARSIILSFSRNQQVAEKLKEAT